MKETIEIIVRGKVQGVFFRATAGIIARDMDITGTVKNLPDGSVFITATGVRSQLNLFKEWCWEGPENAVVTDVTIHLIPLVEFLDFRTVH